MDNSLDRCTEKHRESAVSELRSELADFSYDGLVQLQEDLSEGDVVRGSWGGCVISYKRGGAGSARRDRLGRARNAFTILWDNGWMTDEEVAAAVAHEIEHRRATLSRPPEPSAQGLKTED